MKSCSLLVILVAGLACNSLAVAQERRRPQRVANPGGARAKVEFYESGVDGKRRPYGVCATGDSDRSKPLIVHLQPGLSETVNNPSRAFQQIERVIDIARKNGLECIAIRPTGRGPGSLFQNYGEVDAKITDSGAIVVQTTNVRAFSLGPIAECSRADVHLAGQEITEVDLTRPQTLRLNDTGHWELGQRNFDQQKHHGCSGPIGDLFHENVVLVSGSTGTEEENYFTQMAAYNLRNQFRKTNGGLHRGGIQGENSVMLPYALDTELSDEAICANNLLLFGTPATNRLLKRFEETKSLSKGRNEYHA